MINVLAPIKKKLLRVAIIKRAKNWAQLSNSLTLFCTEISGSQRSFWVKKSCDTFEKRHGHAVKMCQNHFHIFGSNSSSLTIKLPHRCYNTSYYHLVSKKLAAKNKFKVIYLFPTKNVHGRADADKICPCNFER